MTPDERRQLREKHVCYENVFVTGSPEICVECSQPYGYPGVRYPCVVTRLLDALDAAEAELTVLRRRVGEVAGRDGGAAVSAGARLTADEIAALREAVYAAHQEVYALCAGRNRTGGRDWTMSIPVRPTDSDIVIVNGLEAFDRLATAYTAQQAALEAAGRETQHWCPACGARLSSPHQSGEHKESCPLVSDLVATIVTIPGPTVPSEEPYCSFCGKRPVIGESRLNNGMPVRVCKEHVKYWPWRSFEPGADQMQTHSTMIPDVEMERIDEMVLAAESRSFSDVEIAQRILARDGRLMLDTIKRLERAIARTIAAYHAEGDASYMLFVLQEELTATPATPAVGAAVATEQES